MFPSSPQNSAIYKTFPYRKDSIERKPWLPFKKIRRFEPDPDNYYIKSGEGPKMTASYSTSVEDPNFQSGGAEGARTPDLMHAMHALFQLSYSPKKHYCSLFTVHCSLFTVHCSLFTKDDFLPQILFKEFVVPEVGKQARRAQDPQPGKGL